MSMIKRRLSKIEAAIEPPKPVEFEILVEPLASDTDEAWSQHQEELARSVISADRVIVVSKLAKDRHPESCKVSYVETDVEAQMLALSLQPSERGNKDALADLVQGLSGNVIQPGKAGTNTKW